jgi:hypothetical protein
MKSMRSISILSLTVAALLFCATTAKADTFSFSIDPVKQSAVNGDTIAFKGTVSLSSDATAPVYLNGDSNTLNVVGLTLDDSGFWSNFPFSLNPGDSVTAELFAVTVAPGTPDGAYTGTFEIQGGINADAQDVLGAPGFEVDVTSASGVTPEPSSLILLASGLAGLAGTLRRRLTR